MGNSHLICFDASLCSDGIGIGIYDHTLCKNIKRKIPHSNLKQKTNGSFIAEKLALVYTIRYIKESNIKSNIRLFTDNESLANQPISKKLLTRYNIAQNSLSLHWIPREFNKQADKLSKVIQKEKKEHIVDKIKSYPLQNRLNLLKNIAQSKYQIELLKYLLKDSPPPKLPSKKSKDDRPYLKLICTIIDDYEINRLKEYKDTMTPSQAKSMTLSKNRCKAYLNKKYSLINQK
jgi:hypothetical protein